MIQTIYADARNEIIIGEGIPEKFRTCRGVRQGCPLSPILFCLFLEDIDVEWIKFADDVALVSDAVEGLQSILRGLEKYCDRNRMIVNTNKTKVLIFKNGGRRKERGGPLKMRN